MKNYSKILANNIAFYRKKFGYTQEALADKLGITFQAISKWENEQSCPDILILPELAEIFGISIDELFDTDKKGVKKEIHYDLVPDLPWLDDETIRGVVFLGHKILDSSKDISNFTFHLKGAPLNVISYCNIECEGDIAGDANAKESIKCGNINGNINVGNNVFCGNVSGGISAGGDVTCGNIEGGLTSAGDITCGNINGNVTTGSDIICENVENSIECRDIKCDVVNGSVSCQNIVCTQINGDISDKSTEKK